VRPSDSPGRKRRNRTHHRPDPRVTSQLPASTCAACGKQSYSSKKNVKAAAARLYPGDRMRVYECEPASGRWHMTSQPADVTAAHRDRLAGMVSDTITGDEEDSRG
jgi:ribosomal protein L37E